jgi:hypothetical protein
MIAFHPQYTVRFNCLGMDIDGLWFGEECECPNCKKLVIYLLLAESNTGYGQGHNFSGELPADIRVKDRLQVRPKGSNRPPCPPEVPLEYAEDYKEACLVLSDSPKASAALSRRCLQNLLRDHFKVKHQDLSKEIKELLDKKILPSNIADDLDAIRNVGNYAAHPNKNKSTGVIVDVEPGEADWSLEVLEELFDFCFVIPAISQRRRDALNNKLNAMGKPNMTLPSP